MIFYFYKPNEVRIVMKTKTNKKVIIAVILLVISIIIFFKYTPAWAYKIVERQAVSYLCDKYDAKEDEFELVDYAKPHIFFDSVGELVQKPVRVDYSFEFSYKGKNFFVNKIESDFFDDYQLDDLEIWCTTWLQNNVDKRIIGIDITNVDIRYYEMKNHSNGVLLSENNAEIFLNTYYKREDFKVATIFCDNINFEFNKENESLIIQTLKDKINIDSDIYICFPDSKIIKHNSKFVGELWKSYYEREDF